MITLIWVVSLIHEYLQVWEVVFGNLITSKTCLDNSRALKQSQVSNSLDCNIVLVFICHVIQCMCKVVKNYFFFKCGIELLNLHDIWYYLTKICKCFAGSYPPGKISNLIMNINHILLDFIFPVVKIDEFPLSFCNVSLLKTEPTKYL